MLDLSMLKFKKNQKTFYMAKNIISKVKSQLGKILLIFIKRKCP